MLGRLRSSAGASRPALRAAAAQPSLSASVAQPCRVASFASLSFARAVEPLQQQPRARHFRPHVQLQHNLHNHNQQQQAPSRGFASIFSKLRGGKPVEPPLDQQSEFDLIVLGGGSGGLALSREAARLGKKVAVLDYVTPSAHGSTWGLGGTCVNVGCIPKKLFHRAGIIHDDISDAHSYGWRPTPGAQTPEGKPVERLSDVAKLDWAALRLRVHEQIRSLNFGYRQRLKDDAVAYINGLGSFLDPHTVLARFDDGTERPLKAKHIAIAVGNRPKPLGIPGEELAITSDDVFSLENSPGKTLCVGGSYVSLETAGFLNALGLETVVLARSILLRGMDQELADQVGADLEARGTRIVKQSVPVELRKLASGRILVRFRNTQTNEEAEEEFDTVLNAIGRAPSTGQLNLEAAGVQLVAGGKIAADLRTDQTSVEHIFALGDTVQDRPELTPVAIQAGRLLARRLYLACAGEDGNGDGENCNHLHRPPSASSEEAESVSVASAASSSVASAVGDSGSESQALPAADPTGYWKSHAERANQRLYMRYDLIPSTVFTPLEYSMCGLSEEAAVKQLGTKAVRVYHSYFQPLEWTLPSRGENGCYVKIVCDASRSHKVVGLHYLGPNAAEVMQGYAVSMQLGLTYHDLQDSIAIHPCTSEEILLTDIAKDSGLSPIRVGCCG